MSPERTPSHVDWRPYYVIGALLVIALALNAATRNGLWFWYTSVGVAGLLVFVGLARTRILVFPTLSVWMFGVAGAMHYMGGSLSGLHAIGGPNGLYYAFPWWDNLVHVLGSMAMGIAAATLLLAKVTLGRFAIGFLATCVAVTAGTLVELWEFSQFVWLGTVDQGFYTNTLIDLWNNVIGGALGAFLYLRVAPASAAAEDAAVRSARRSGDVAPRR